MSIENNVIMATNFDEMDIEPNTESSRNLSPYLLNMSPLKDSENRSPEDEELQNQLLQRTVPLEDGNVGYVFTCTKNGPLTMWRCHACSFIDTWKMLLKHIESSWHRDIMAKFHHSRANFSKIESAMPDISKGQPLPPGMEDEISGPCQISKTLESYDQPLIGLEFLLELNFEEWKEPRYLCLLCDKRGDPRSILVHLTSQSHYMMYLRKYFRKFYSLIDKLPKSNECRTSVNTVTSHLIAKLEEKYGRLQPSGTREDVINIPEQRSIIIQKIDSGVHFSENPEDEYLEDMLTIEYVQNTHLLVKNFPLKPKISSVDRKSPDSDPKSLFNKKSTSTKKQLRERQTNREESPELLYIAAGSSRKDYHRSPDRGDYRKGTDYRRSPESRSYRYHRTSKSPPYSHKSHHRSPSPPYQRSMNKYRSRSRSPRNYHSRSPPPYDKYDRYHEKYHRSRSPSYSKHYSSKYSHHFPYSQHHRSPEKFSRRHSPASRISYMSKYRGHSRSVTPPPRIKERPFKSRSRSTSKSRAVNDTLQSSKSVLFDSTRSKISKDKENFVSDDNFAYRKELKEIEEKLNKDLERYSETPETHPAYQEEWKKFWSNRFKELQLEGKCDPHTYDYKPEWINFWNIRMKELHNEEFENCKKKLKTKYNVKEHDNSVNGSEKEVTVKYDLFESNKKPVVDIKTMWKELTGFDIKEDNPPKRKALSPWEEDNDNDNDNSTTGLSPKQGEDDKLSEKSPKISTQPISPGTLSSISDSDSLHRTRSPTRGSRSPIRSPIRHSRSKSYSRSRSRSPTFHPYMKEIPIPTFKIGEGDAFHRKPSTKKIHFDNPLNIITVLRQLSVLEFQLGSYASHVISLLSSGLAMERLKPQSSVDLLTKENVIFLELVKEKLKGQLLAGVVQKSMVKATLFCIKNIEELLLLAPKMKLAAPPPVPAPPPGLLFGAEISPNVPPPGMHSAVIPPPGIPPIPMPTAGAGPQQLYGAHVYAPYGSQPPKHYDNNKFKSDRYHRKFSPKRPDHSDYMNKISPSSSNDRYHRSPDRYPFRNSSNGGSFPKNQYPFAEASKNVKPLASSISAAPPVEDEDIPIDKMLIAKQIAEVLTTQGRTDVSEEELQTLINTVVKNLKEVHRSKISASGSMGQMKLLKEDFSTNNATLTSAIASVTGAAGPLSSLGASSNIPATPSVSGVQNFPSIPAGFNLNDVSNSTLAMLQDAFSNVSALSSVEQFEQLPESELISLLRNFKNIPRFKQEKVIQYLRQLEETDPDRVEKLKKYVNVS